MSFLKNHNSSSSNYDREATMLLNKYITKLTIAGYKKYEAFIRKSKQDNDCYEVVFYLSEPTYYRRTVEEAYQDALDMDDEHPSFIRRWKVKGDEQGNCVCAVQCHLFGNYINEDEMYDEKGWLKKEVKDLAIRKIKVELLII